MKYYSTRNRDLKLSASEAILKGLADDGGLFVPEKIPKIDYEMLLTDSYQLMAYKIFKLYLSDFSDERLKSIVENAYDGRFTSKGRVDVVTVGDDSVLELFHGPTLAFKDMALSGLPHLMVESKKILGINQETVVLTATSGDTGKAALEGFADVEGISIIVFYPNEGVSQIQQLQMITQTGKNTHVVAINGNFDDAQSAVKEVFSNKSFRNLLNLEGKSFSSANSINIGRLIPQIVYYFYAYIEMLKSKKINYGEKIKIVVPTGNFGNILAAYYAKEMGLPVEKLICASNENNILSDFINTGVYDTHREFLKTISPSMDILISSNLERFIFEIIDRDADKMGQLMKQLVEKGKFTLEEKYLKRIKRLMSGDFATKEETENTIKTCYEKNGYLLDPHTAVAYKVAEGEEGNLLIASTASPYKFGYSILDAFGEDSEKQSINSVNDEIFKLSKMNIPHSLKNIEDKKVLHHTVCETHQIEDTIKAILKVGV